MTTLDRVKVYFGLPDDLGPSPVEIKGACRKDLPALFASLGYTEGVEVGVYRGRFSRMLCEGNPNLHLTCVDAWKAYAAYRDFTDQAHLNAAFEEAKARLAPYGCTFIRADSTKAADQIPDASLDCCYIDDNHAFLYVIQSLCAWWPKIKPGGILAGHDYRQFRRSLNIRVVEAVHGFTAAHDIDPWFVLGRNKVKKGEVRDRERSFFWVKNE